MRPLILASLLTLSACGPGGVLGPPDGYGASNECIDESDCKNGESCWSPGSCNQGVAPESCFNFECPQDYECVSVNRCGAESVCMPDCRVLTDACSETETCDMSTGRCTTIPCDEPGGVTCGANFECSGGGGNGCTRITCSDDGDCDGGTCWAGGCYASASYCGFAAP